MVKNNPWFTRFFTVLAAILFLVITACTVLPESGTKGEEQMPQPKTLTDPDEIELFNQIQRSAAGREDVLAFIVYDVVIDHVQFSADGQLALVWIALVDKEKGFIQPGEPGLVIARKTADVVNPWQITFQADVNFTEVLSAVPEGMLSKEDRLHYMPAIQQEEKSPALFRGYRLPWTNGQTVRLTGSIGHVYTYKSCPADCLYAFDFANGTMFPVRAARRGTVKYAVWGNANGNPTKANYLVLEDTSTTPTTYQVYLHLAQNSIPPALRNEGAQVVQGQFLGNADDTGYSTGHHLHFHVHTNATSYWGRSVDIAFDDVSINGGRPRLCSEAKAFPQFGTECMLNDKYISRNSDAETPTGGINSPAGYATVTSPILNVSGWMKDDVAVLSAQLMYTVKGEWKPIGEPQTQTPFTASIDLCQARIPNGKFFLSVVVRDQAGKVSEDTQGLTELEKQYDCPPLPPVCTPAETQIAFFTDTEFQGTCQIVEKGEYPDMNEFTQIKADSARSILIGSGVSALVYPEAGFAGALELFQDGDADLSDNPTGTANAAAVRVIDRIVPPTPPGISLPQFITADTDLSIVWSSDAGVETRASISGQDGYANALDWQTGGSWQVGKLPVGEYSLVIDSRNLAGETSITQPFTVAPGALPPVTSMESLPQISNSTAIRLNWTAENGTNEIDHFELQWREQNGEWQDWSEPLSSSTRQLLFIGTGERTYEFRIRAVDTIGTLEVYPEVPDTFSFINTGCSDDMYEGVAPGDDESATSSAGETGVIQTRSWCPLSDVDWVTFQAKQGESYSFSANSLRPASAARMQLYGADGTTLLGEARPENLDGEANLEWKAPMDGTYFIKLTPADERIGGQEAVYQFKYERKSTLNPGILICSSAAIPVLFGGAYATVNKTRKKKKAKVLGY